MGITIHYQGRLKGSAALKELTARVKPVAEQREWLYKEIDAKEATLIRSIDEEIVEYVGPVKGIMVLPHVESEAVRFIFDKDWYMQEFTKTQSCPVSVHVEVVELLRSVQDLFDDFKVIDEGEYWETGNTDLLERKQSFLGDQIERLKGMHPDAEGPVDIPDTRFEDRDENSPENGSEEAT